MTTIYLIRHGQKQLHAGDPELTDVGISQAKQTGKYLQQFPITQIISSPFKRTVETAFYISKALNLKHSLNDALVERMNWNDESISRKEFLQEWIKATNDRNYISKYGDSSHNTGDRMHKLIEDLSADGSHIVLVTHGGAILD